MRVLRFTKLEIDSVDGARTDIFKSSALTGGVPICAEAGETMLTVDPSGCNDGEYCVHVDSVHFLDCCWLRKGVVLDDAKSVYPEEVLA